MAEAENTYQSQFTKENILSLKSHVSKAINEYAEQNVDGGKLDLFLILAALGQSAYEVVINTLPKDEEDAKKSVDEMKVMVDKYIIETDKTGQEHGFGPTTKLLAAAHLMSIMSEYYSRRRDAVVKDMLQEAAKSNSAEIIQLEQKKEQE